MLAAATRFFEWFRGSDACRANACKRSYCSRLTDGTITWVYCLPTADTVVREPISLIWAFYYVGGGWLRGGGGELLQPFS